MQNIKIGDVLKSKDETFCDITIMEILNNLICYKWQYKFLWDTKDYIQENYIIPEVKWVPKIGQIYCVVDIATLRISRCEIWKNDEIDNHRLKNKLAFATKEETISRAEEILKLIN